MSETIKIDGKVIKCPCYIDKPLHRYNKGCLIQSQAFSEQQTQEKPILRCDEIKNCPIKEQYMQFENKNFELIMAKTDLCKGCQFRNNYKKKEQECEELKEKLERQKDYTITYKSYIYEEEKQLKKQLQAKEQECEKLKTQILSLQIMKIEEYKKLKQECKELKKQYNCYACGTCKGKEDYRNMKRHCENAIKANHKYKQTLEEIEEFCTVYSDNHDAYETVYKFILSIINKAKDGE